jgi:hypothetical protein
MACHQAISVCAVTGVAAITAANPADRNNAFLNMLSPFYCSLRPPCLRTKKDSYRPERVLQPKNVQMNISDDQVSKTKARYSCCINNLLGGLMAGATNVLCCVAQFVFV